MHRLNAEEFRDWTYVNVSFLVCLVLTGLAILTLASILVNQGGKLKGDVNDLETFLEDTFNLEMDSRCDDGNPCTWDFITEDQFHCKNIKSINGVPCQKQCHKESQCTLGECQGECIGSCEYNSDCPLVPAHPFIPVVDFGGHGICFSGKCIYAYFHTHDVLPVSSHICHQIHDTNSERGCTDLISRHSPYHECMQSTWCHFHPTGDFCLLSFQCSRYNFGPELIASGNISPVMGFGSQFPNGTDIVSVFVEQFGEEYNFEYQTGNETDSN